MTTTRKCIDSDTQVMVPATAGQAVQCGNCGQGAATYQQPLRGGGTILAIAKHAMPA